METGKGCEKDGKSETVKEANFRCDEDHHTQEKRGD